MWTRELMGVWGGAAVGVSLCHAEGTVVGVRFGYCSVGWTPPPGSHTLLSPQQETPSLPPPSGPSPETPVLLSMPRDVPREWDHTLDPSVAGLVHVALFSRVIRDVQGSVLRSFLWLNGTPWCGQSPRGLSPR